MTTEDRTPAPIVAGTGAEAPTGADGAAGPVAMLPPVEETAERDRRKKGLLLLLAALFGVFVLFSGWYLITRKPITELPLPGIGDVHLPKYSFSIYGITAPVGVAANADGSRIYATESGGERLVHIFDSKGSQVGTITAPKTVPGSRVPVYLALDPSNGDVYVSDRMAATVYVYDKDGAFRRKFAPKPTMSDWQPIGLAFDPAGNLYVSDVAGPVQRIEVFGRDGTLQRTIGDPGEFSYPNGVAVDAKGDVFVADGNNGRLEVFDPTGRQIAVIPRGVALGELGLPRGVALDDSGRLYVADATGMTVQVYTLDQATKQPKYLGTLGVEGVGDGQFSFPNGVAVDTRARLYVADMANNRVQVWSY